VAPGGNGFGGGLGQRESQGCPGQGTSYLRGLTIAGLKLLYERKKLASLSHQHSHTPTPTYPHFTQLSLADAKNR
jgi:hypothetical protein